MGKGEIWGSHNNGVTGIGTNTDVKKVKVITIVSGL